MLKTIKEIQTEQNLAGLNIRLSKEILQDDEARRDAAAVIEHALQLDIDLSEIRIIDEITLYELLLKILKYSSQKLHERLKRNFKIQEIKWQQEEDNTTDYYQFLCA